MSITKARFKRRALHLHVPNLIAKNLLTKKSISISSLESGILTGYLDSLKYLHLKIYELRILNIFDLGN